MAKMVNISRILGDNTKYIPFKSFPAGKQKIVPFSKCGVTLVQNGKLLIIYNSNTIQWTELYEFMLIVALLVNA